MILPTRKFTNVLPTVKVVHAVPLPLPLLEGTGVRRPLILPGVLALPVADVAHEAAAVAPAVPPRVLAQTVPLIGAVITVVRVAVGEPRLAPLTVPFAAVPIAPVAAAVGVVHVAVGAVGEG